MLVDDISNSWKSLCVKIVNNLRKLVSIRCMIRVCLHLIDLNIGRDKKVPY